MNTLPFAFDAFLLSGMHSSAGQIFSGFRTSETNQSKSRLSKFFLPKQATTDSLPPPAGQSGGRLVRSRDR